MRLVSYKKKKVYSGIFNPSVLTHVFLWKMPPPRGLFQINFLFVQNSLFSLRLKSSEDYNTQAYFCKLGAE